MSKTAYIRINLGGRHYIRTWNEFGEPSNVLVSLEEVVENEWIDPDLDFQEVSPTYIDSDYYDYQYYINFDEGYKRVIDYVNQNNWKIPVEAYKSELNAYE